MKVDKVIGLAATGSYSLSSRYQDWAGGKSRRWAKRTASRAARRYGRRMLREVQS